MSLLLFFSMSCLDNRNDENRQTSVAAREQTFSRAQSLIPDPQPQNFPLRRALAKFTERQDEIDHPWYIYILGQQGNVVGYYVGQTVPINACDFLSSTERISNPHGNGNVILTAPSLDGIFYGGSGSSSGCDSWFWFDTVTDALIQIRGIYWYAADQPLRIEAEPIVVQK